MLDLHGIEDENERAIKKKLIRKSGRNYRSHWKNPPRRANRIWTPPEPEGKSPVAPSPTYESGSHAPTFSRGTKLDSSYEQLSEIPILTSGEELHIHIHELILNSSMEDVLGGDTDEFTPSYNDLKRFMLKVVLFHNFAVTCLT